MLFFQWIPAAVFTVGRRASGRAGDRHLVLCACLGLLREVSLTQAAVEAFYTTTTTAIYHALFSVDPRAAGGRGVLSSSEYVMCDCIVLPAVHAILLCSKGCWWR
jgi:hypothetical protein